MTLDLLEIDSGEVTYGWGEVDLMGNCNVMLTKGSDGWLVTLCSESSIIDICRINGFTNIITMMSIDMYHRCGHVLLL